MLKEQNVRGQKIEMEVKNLHEIIAMVETIDVFCNAHELVARNSITQKRFKILNAISDNNLKPFYFLINKN